MYWDTRAWVIGWVQDGKQPDTTTTKIGDDDDGGGGAPAATVTVRMTIVVGCISQEQNQQETHKLRKSGDANRQGTEETCSSAAATDHQYHQQGRHRQRQDLQNEIDDLVLNLQQHYQSTIIPSSGDAQPSFDSSTQCDQQSRLDSDRITNDKRLCWCHECQRHICGYGLSILGFFEPESNQHQRLGIIQNDGSGASNNKDQPQRIFARISSNDKQQQVNAGRQEEFSFPWFLTTIETRQDNLEENKQNVYRPAYPNVACSAGQVIFYEDSISHSYRQGFTSSSPLDYLITSHSSYCQQRQPSHPTKNVSSLFPFSASSAASWLVRIHNAPMIHQKLLSSVQNAPPSSAESAPSEQAPQQEDIEKDDTLPKEPESAPRFLQNILSSPIVDLVLQSSLMFRLLTKYRKDPSSLPLRILLTKQRHGQLQNNDSHRLLLKDEMIQRQVNATGSVVYAVWSVSVGIIFSLCVIYLYLKVPLQQTQSHEVDLSMVTTTPTTWFVRLMQWQFQWLKLTLLMWLQKNPIGIKLNFHLASALTTVLAKFLDAVERIWVESLPALVSSLFELVDDSFALRKILLVLIAFLPTAIGGLSGWLAFIHDIWQMATCHLRIMAQVVGALFQMECHVLVATGRLFRGQKRNVLRNHRTDSMQYDSTQLLLGSIVFAVALFLFTTILVYQVAFLILEWVVAHAVSALLVAAFQQQSVENLPLLLGALYYQNVKGMKWFPWNIFLVHDNDAVVETTAATCFVDVTQLHCSQCTLAKLVSSMTTARTLRSDKRPGG
ncbi:hypothetical protein ACA910_006657 [Epithemia clementina (nom. ined.)]